MTPQRAVDALHALASDPRIQPAFYNVNDYISTGHNRKIDYNNFAPRIGFPTTSMPTNGRSSSAGMAAITTARCSATSAEEALLTQYTQSGIHFSRNGLPINGVPTSLESIHS